MNQVFSKYTFCLSIKDDTQRTSNKRYYPSNVEIKDYNVIISNFADMQLISKFNKVIRFLLCVSDIFINMHGLFL